MSSKVYGVVRVILLAGIVGYLAWQIFSGWVAVKSVALRWDGLSLAGALVSGIAAYGCLFLGWVMLLRQAGCFEVRQLGLYARIWWVSYLYRYVPGKVLLLVERARMGSAVGIPPVAGAALAIIETLFAILAGSAVSLMAVSYYAGIYDHLFSASYFCRSAQSSYSPLDTACFVVFRSSKQDIRSCSPLPFVLKTCSSEWCRIFSTTCCWAHRSS